MGEHVQGAVRWQTVTMVCETCCSCGMPFYMPQEFKNRKLEYPGENFYCPAGHGQHYLGKSKDAQIEELKREAARERELRLTASARAQQNYITSRQIAGKLRKLKTRVGAGVCPCCNRTFSQLARHMQTQHPTYGGAE